MSSLLVVDGRYRLLDRLGGSGPEGVWRGYDQVLDRTVAVKLLGGDSIGAAERERARVEANTAAQLSHPHICQIYSYGESWTESGDRVAYLVMELLSGPTLEERLRAYPMPVGVALQVGAQVASALASAHSRGLMHRDLTTVNVILAPAGPKIVNFGLPGTGRTPAWLAPERLRYGKPNPASDVYALGMVIYRMVSGTEPWPAETVTRMLAAREYQPPAPLPMVDALPEPVAELCHRCLAENPRERPTAHEVARLLAHAVGLRVLRAGEQLVTADDNVARNVARSAPEPVATEAPPAPPPTEARPALAEAALEHPPAVPPVAAVAATPQPERWPPAPGSHHGNAAHPHVQRPHFRRWPVLFVATAIIAIVAVVIGGVWLAAKGGPHTT